MYRSGAVDGMRKILCFRAKSRSVVPLRRPDGMAQAEAGSSSLDPLDTVYRASDCRRCHDRLRVGRPRQLGGQSDYAFISNPFRCRLVAAESRGYRDRGCRGAANIAAMAYSLCRELEPELWADALPAAAE